jgi:NAD(P)-dependent dehydrogenase (short-subunit alcohol dehydrogenase family)
VNPFDLNGRRYLITGASSGIGRETAIFLSRLGAQLALAGRNKMRLEETRAALAGEGHEMVPFDLSRGEEIPAWLKVITTQMGPLDGLVHAAGIQNLLPLKMVESKDVDSMMQVNVGAAVMLAKGFRQKGVHAAVGSIVFLSSVAGLVGEAGLSLYSASKGAIIALTKSLALELARDHIRVNSVAPAYVRTPMFEAAIGKMGQEQFAALMAAHPLGIGRPLDVAYAIAYLLADTGAWVTGTALVVDGGYTAR